jgi:hypothetical protein
VHALMGRETQFVSLVLKYSIDLKEIQEREATLVPRHCLEGMEDIIVDDAL